MAMIPEVLREQARNSELLVLAFLAIRLSC